MLNIGNLVAHRTLLSPPGKNDDGPVDPKHPPKVFVQMTKKRSVSIAFPGPTKSSHQPAFEDVDGETSFPREATCEDAERPVCRRMALDAVELRVPHVSYAIV